MTCPIIEKTKQYIRFLDDKKVIMIPQRLPNGSQAYLIPCFRGCFDRLDYDFDRKHSKQNFLTDMFRR